MEATTAVPISGNVSVASVTLGATTTITVASGGFPNVFPGQAVTKSSGTGSLTAGTTVVSVSGNNLVLNQIPATTGTATLAFNSTVVGPSNPTGYVYIHGITLIESGGSASVTLKITDGGVSTGNLIAGFTLAQGTGLGNGILPRVKISNQAYVTFTGTGVALGTLLFA